MHGGGWAALYTASDLATALSEVVRNDPDDRRRTIRFSEIHVHLGAVADCRDLDALSTDSALLFDDWDYSTGQALAWAARDAGAEAILVPSASGLGDNLVIFPDRLRPGSTLMVVGSVDPSLVKDPR